MNKEKKTKASIDNIYTLKNEIPLLATVLHVASVR